MSEQSDNRFYHYARKYLREEFPAETKSLSDDALKDLIDKGLRSARKYGFTAEAEAVSYIDIDLRFEGILSDDKKRPEWAEEILGNRNLSAGEKNDILRDVYCSLAWIRSAS